MSFSSHKSARFFSRDKTNRRHVKKRKREKERMKKGPSRNGVMSRGVETLKCCGEREQGLTVRVYGTSGETSLEILGARIEKIIVNLKQSVSTRAALSGNRKQFNIRSYRACDGKDTHAHEDTHFFGPH